MSSFAFILWLEDFHSLNIWPMYIPSKINEVKFEGVNLNFKNSWATSSLQFSQVNRYFLSNFQSLDKISSTWFKSEISYCKEQLDLAHTFGVMMESSYGYCFIAHKKKYEKEKGIVFSCILPEVHCFARSWGSKRRDELHEKKKTI